MNPWHFEAATAHRGWPLLILRYVFVTVGVAGWLAEFPHPQPVLVAISLLVALLLDLFLSPLLTGQPPRKVEPVPAAILACQGAGTLAAYYWGESPALLLVVGGVVLGATALLPPPWSAVWFAGAFVAVMGIQHYSGSRAGPDLLATIYIMLGFVVVTWLGFTAWLGARRREEYEATVARLEEAQGRLATLAGRIQDLTAERERRHILGEIHDALGHSLTAGLLQVQVARRLLAGGGETGAAVSVRQAEKNSPELGEVKERLAAVESTLRQALKDVRRALRRALPGEARPLALALKTLAQDLAAAGGPRVEVSLQPDANTISDLSAEKTKVLVRTVQEAMTNAVRHGQAETIYISVRAQGGRLFLRVTDDGAGAAVLVPGMGLAAMTARVQEIGGTIRFHTAAGEGFTVEVGVRPP